MDNKKIKNVLHLSVQLDGSSLSIRPVWSSEGTLPYTVTRYIETLFDMVQICIEDPHASVYGCMSPATHDLDWIWKWNHDLPPLHEFCMQDMIAERAQTNPEKVGIESWDGTLTYGQIDRYSTFLAIRLQDLGVKLHDFVPLCFEKSRWTIVAVLAVMKAGATIAMMDPSLPLARLQNMATQVNADTIVSSRLQNELANLVLPEGKHITVDADTFANLSDSQTFPALPPVPSTALMYIIFTSGSTGTPKGVKISHETYTSSAIPRAKAVGYCEDSRVLDFASYAFDVSIDSMLLTLGNGGCLCIPSDEDRLNDINGVMRDMRINYAGITPSVARILEDDVIASLSALGLGGEASAPRDVNLWGQNTRIVIGYGPCECTIGCTVNSSAATGRDYISIGPGNGASMWIVDPNDHEILLPVGAVGELLVEGPIVGQGYLNDPAKTEAAFIHDPSWLLAGHNGYAGRRGRLYKTGDLGMYDPDGSGEIVFAGRKDTQVKLRGQRVELGEIESQLKARLPSDTNVIAEVIVPTGSRGNPTLVAFIAPQSSKLNDLSELEPARLPVELDRKLSVINKEISTVLPRYMVPNAYIPINFIPTLISGKTDRKRLRQFGTTVDLRQLEQETTTTTPEATRELTDLEKRLRHGWNIVLKLDEDSIQLSDNFFALGGDSLAAMRLVTACREDGLSLSVTSTIDHPTLLAMAQVVRPLDGEAKAEILPFSLISQSVENATMRAAEICGVELAAVEDIYPCTPTQESLITFSIKATEPYVAQRVACVPTTINIEDLKKAWEVVVGASPILRTRVAQLQDSGLQQVVLRESINWRYSTDLEQYLKDDKSEEMSLGQNLARYAIVQDKNDGKTYMVWTAHHVLYDGWSEPVILQMVRDAFKNGSIEFQMKSQMRDFVRYVRDTDEVAMKEFWEQDLNGAVGPQFPRQPSRDFMPKPDAMIEHRVHIETNERMPFTMATLIRGAWAIVSSQHCGSDDIVFGETFMGRDVPLPDVENILGPLIATVPVRIRIDRTGSVESYLQSIQQATSARAPYQHMGMQYIRRVSQDAQRACEAPTGLVIQPEPEYTGDELGFGNGDPVREALHFNPYPLMLAFGLHKGGFRVCANFDSSIVEVAQMERVLAQLEAVCLHLTKNLSGKIKEVSCLPEADLAQIWRWNQTPPLALDGATKNFRAGTSVNPGSVYPRVAIPWVCDASNPSLLSPIGCPGELWLEVASPLGQTAKSPAWLKAGTSEYAGREGHLQPTGDIVQLRPDGELIFLGRKESFISVQGHTVDITELEGHFTRFLSPARATAAVFVPSSNGTEETEEQELIIVTEKGPSEPKNLELMFMKHEISCGEEESQISITICADISVSLATSLKKLDKFIQDDLPSSLAPSAYVVVEKIPLQDGHVDRHVLQQLVTNIPSYVLKQVRDGLNKAWETGLGQADLTVAERILRTAWSEQLGTRPEQIDLEDNFFRLGGDSVMAMRLVSGLRAQGHVLSVADIFQHMRLGDAAKVMKLNQIPSKKVSVKPFVTLDSSDVEHFLSEVVRPKLADPTWSVKDAYAVTDTQALDIKATLQAPRTSVQYTMLYFQNTINREKLIGAFKDLVKTHDILRTVFIEHESSFFQIILDNLDAQVATKQTDTQLEQFVTELCTTDIESEFHLGSPFLRVFYVEGKDNQSCLVLGLSHAQYDGTSLPKLLEDLETLYSGGKVTNFETFSTYMSQISDKAVQSKALGYWRNLLDGSSMAVLDEQSTQLGDKGIFKEALVEGYQPLADITTANVLTAAWALVLARHVKNPDVTFGAVTSGRSMNMLNVENVVGPCYQFTPVRVPFESQWTAIDLLRFVQKQNAESAAYDFVGFSKISKECTQWSSEVGFFDSIVHYQDWDDSDSMPFAGETIKVDILNPHGDAAYPLKAVSFLKDGQLHIGVVGSEKDSAFVDAIQAELMVAVEELTNGQAGHVLVDAELFQALN